MKRTQEQNCHDWIELFVRLGADGAPSLERLAQITRADVRFRDPFHDLSGQEALRALLQHTARQVREVKFDLLDSAVSGQHVYLKWRMSGKVRLLGDWQVLGMSELVFDNDGQLCLHQDYWDAAEQFYARLPFIGWLWRWLRWRAAAC
jgi:steroid delta-isomerase